MKTKEINFADIIKNNKNQYEAACKAYLELFYKLHGFEEPYDYDVWVGGDVGGIAEIADYFFNFSDIRYDVDHFDADEYIFKWYDYSLLLRELELPKNISYEDWCKGVPLPYTEEDIAKIKGLKAKVYEAKLLLENEIERLKK